METHISIFLSKLILAFGDFKNGFLEIIVNNKRETIPYPQTTPVSIILPPKFMKDKQLITINAKKKIGNKVKIMAHGELILYRINIIEGRGTVEKIITMSQLDSKNDSIKINKDNMGRIIVKVSLEEPFDEWKKKSLNKGCFSSNNILNRKQNDKNANKSYKKINFDDNLSTLTITKIDKNKNDDLKNINIEKYISVNEIIKLKDLFDNDYQNILPHDFAGLKKLNINLYNHYQQLDKNYKNMLENINKENNDIKIKAKRTWEKYKENKRNLYKSRIEYKLKQQKLKKEINSNKEEKTDLIKSANILNNNTKNVFNQILGQKEENQKNNINEKENDIQKMSIILNKLYALGYNVEDEMNEEEKKILNNILNKNSINKDKDIKEEKKEEIKKEIKEEKRENNTENKNEEKKNVDMHEAEQDERLGQKIVTLIERDVNDLYSRQLIEKMKIDQINCITYSFATNKKEKTISFSIRNNNLICSNGQSFSVWLISNFNS